MVGSKATCTYSDRNAETKKKMKGRMNPAFLTFKLATASRCIAEVFRARRAGAPGFGEAVDVQRALGGFERAVPAARTDGGRVELDAVQLIEPKPVRRGSIDVIIKGEVIRRCLVTEAVRIGSIVQVVGEDAVAFVRHHILVRVVLALLRRGVVDGGIARGTLVGRAAIVVRRGLLCLVGSYREGRVEAGVGGCTHHHA